MTVNTIDVPVTWGNYYRDKATGFSGVAVGVWLKWGDQTQVALARIGQDGKPFEMWFDLWRLEETSRAESSGGHV